MQDTKLAGARDLEKNQILDQKTISKNIKIRGFELQLNTYEVVFSISVLFLASKSSAMYYIFSKQKLIAVSQGDQCKDQKADCIAQLDCTTAKIIY